MKREFEWNDRWLDVFAELCRTRWGFRFRTSDAVSLRTRVERAYQASSAGSVDEFAKQLAASPDTSPEVQAFVSQVAVGETSFFRNQAQFSALSNMVLPELAARRRAKNDRSLRLWSAGCSTGEEPYSLAIALVLCLPDWKDWNIEILATDINPYALRRASEAIYSDWSFREVDPNALSAFFASSGRTRRLIHDCRTLVRFRTLNLATAQIPEPASGLDAFDVIFCRNVMIYFEPALVEQTVQSFLEALVPGGWLFVGHTEPDSALFTNFDAREFPDTILYQKPFAVRFDAPKDAASQACSRDVGVPTLVETPAGHSVPASLDAALDAYHAADLDSAREVLLELHRLDGGSPLPAHLLAQIAADRRMFDEALYWAFSALHADPFHVATHLLKGLVHLELDEPRVAQDAFRKAVFLDSLCPEAHYYLSLAHHASGEDELAARSRERAARLCATLTDAGDLLPVQGARRVLCQT
jgi:chemotaxis protein methyltransferase CheR